jgi:hypothetical protein
MPYKIKADPEHPGKKEVVNSATGDVKGSAQDPEDAASQYRLLEGIDHGWKPDGRPSNSRTRTRRNPDGKR